VPARTTSAASFCAAAAQFVRHQVKIEREDIGRLRACTHGSVGCDERALECGLDLDEGVAVSAASLSFPRICALRRKISVECAKYAVAIKSVEVDPKLLPVPTLKKSSQSRNAYRRPDLVAPARDCSYSTNGAC